MKKTEKTITGSVDPDVLEFTVSDDPILDRELVKWDAAGTAAHVTMLSRMKMPKGVPAVVTPAEAAKVRRELAKVVKEFASFLRLTLAFVLLSAKYLSSLASFCSITFFKCSFTSHFLATISILVVILVPLTIITDFLHKVFTCFFQITYFCIK